jgi:hypothetical protein
VFRENQHPGPQAANKEEDKIKEFRAVINDNTSLFAMEKRNMIQIIVKKELTDYELNIIASEAPIKNFLPAGELLPYEYIVAEKEIIEKELFPFNDAIRKVFGNLYDLKLNSIRLCVGTEDDYLTIDESDLKEVNINPTLNGLKEFMQVNKKSIYGFTIRYNDVKKGNLVFCECDLNRPILDKENGIQSIKISILANLSQRGLYMQQHYTGFGMHLYYIFKINKFSDQLIDFFNELKIPIEMIYLKRKSSIQNWCAIECELDEKNLKDYLQFQYTSLSHSDVEQIVSIVRENKFNFEVARMIGDLLNRMKQDRVEVEDRLFSLEQEDIAAATKLVINYFGINEQNLSLPSNLNFNSIKKSIEKLDHYIH